MPELSMKLSVLPFLLVIELVAIWLATRRAARAGQIGRGGMILINVLLALLSVWAAFSSWLAVSGFYQSAFFLNSWPSFWVTFIAVAIVMTPLMVSRAARDTTRAVIDATPLSWLVGIQALRIFAIGGILKALNGQFSHYWGLSIGVPDFFFGLSSLAVAWLVSRGLVGHWTVVLWNLLGATIIAPVGLVLMQMGLPGAWRIFNETPGINTIFEFPMALAPTIVVPIFVMMNLLVAIRLVERSMTEKQ